MLSACCAFLDANEQDLNEWLPPMLQQFAIALLNRILSFCSALSTELFMDLSSEVDSQSLNASDQSHFELLLPASGLLNVFVLTLRWPESK